MKRIIPFSHFFVPAVVFSLLIIAAGVAGYVIKGGFNLGVDFKAGLLQEIQFASQAFAVTYTGKGNATLNFNRNGLTVVVTGTETRNEHYAFEFARYPAFKDITDAMKNDISGLEITLSAPEDTKSVWLIENTQRDTQLDKTTPYLFYYLDPSSKPIDITEVRRALSAFGSASVQILGTQAERRFMIRLEDEKKSKEDEEGAVKKDITEQNALVIQALENQFGAGSVTITRSDYVGSRFSKQLQDQAGILITLTMLLILIYASIRFKPQFAIGAILSMAHDALVMVCFIVWVRMEFNTITIAAILTVIGYSINDTIVVFDRIREAKRLYQDDTFRNVLDRALTETLGRTIITTLTTMLAVSSLYFFTTGSMKDFALALLVGMFSGIYSTIFIASGWTLLWEKYFKRNKKNQDKKASLSVVSDKGAATIA